MFELFVRIMRWIQDYESDDENAKRQSGLKFVILDLSGESLEIDN